MLGFDLACQTLTFGDGAARPAQSLSFSHIRRLTLTSPLQAVPRLGSARGERVPVAAQEREYSLHPGGVGEPLKGRTAGHIETPEGMYLFTPVDEEASLQRVFVPRSSYARYEFGPTAEESAAKLWTARPSELLDAIERQGRKPVLPIGQSLLALGMLTKHQLDRALAKLSDGVPLGESLVSSGLISKDDLQTALAHKMGYPLVDLTRFPIDAAAVSKLPRHLVASCRAVPLMLDNDRLIVAVDRPSRIAKLRDIESFARLTVVAVLAPKVQIKMSLESLLGSVWAHNVPERSGFFATTA